MNVLVVAPWYWWVPFFGLAIFPVVSFIVYTVVCLFFEEVWLEDFLSDLLGPVIDLVYGDRWKLWTAVIFIPNVILTFIAPTWAIWTAVIMSLILPAAVRLMFWALWKK